MRSFLFVIGLCGVLCAQTGISQKTAAFQKMPGFFPVYWDAKGGKMFLEIDKWDQEFLYVSSLPAGLGSNDIGLDRGQLGATRVVKFQRIGPKVLLVQMNYRFRAVTDQPAERRDVEQAFAQSVIWGFQVEFEEGNRAVVDATNFFLRDSHNVTATLQKAKEGTYKPDATRSAFFLPATKNFPKNTEVETTITFTGEPQGRFVPEVTPSPDAITVREHHSFIELPDAGYRPRAYDPRAGYFGIQYMDFAASIDAAITKRFIDRHRLQKKDPSAAMSDPVKPIVYYLDAGTPEPVRSALLEGARWWNQAFEAAGYRNAFQVEMMPDGADPMDVRYNVIQWVHRSTRGWSYGATVTDPRTGEIIKGHVSLGSLRVRQDFMIAEGLLAPYLAGKPVPETMLNMSLARLRQLAAHEVGHTLGLAHNYVASTHSRASVMDYPSPLVTLSKAGVPELGDAYAVGIGEWDKVAIAYGYREGDVTRVIEDAYKRGLYFLTDADARPAGSAHPDNHLWDNGANAVDELNRMMTVRAAALARFSENNIPVGRPMSDLGETLVPIYLLHRYQVEAAAKSVGGLFYTYALRGDGQKVTEIVSGKEQARALDALLKTISPDALTLPERILRLIPPKASGFLPREPFRGRTGLTFDALAPAEAAANLTVSFLLDQQRTARLVEQHARLGTVAGLDTVIDRLIAATWKAPRASGLAAEVQHVVEDVVVYHLMALAKNDAAPAQVRAIVSQKLEQIRASLSGKPGAHAQYEAAQIKQFQQSPKEFVMLKPVEPPPGQPIGCEELH
jgi:hypothetical protein